MEEVIKLSTVVRATCPNCGDVKLDKDAFVVRVLEGHEEGEYRFTCICGKIIVKDAAANIVALLVSSGVRKEVWELPLELMEHPEEGTLAEDDVIDLHIAFEDGSAFDKITRSNGEN